MSRNAMCGTYGPRLYSSSVSFRELAADDEDLRDGKATRWKETGGELSTDHKTSL